TLLMALLATVQLGVFCRISVSAFKVLQLAVEGEVWPQSAHAIGIQNERGNLYSASEYLLVTNNFYRQPICGFCSL
ncbi:hypothetical protein B0H11DRAFT_2025573, partial [Mycena galericulata]